MLISESYSVNHYNRLTIKRNYIILQVKLGSHKNHNALKIVKIVLHYPSILCFSPGWLLVKKFSLKYFLKSRAENPFVNFYVCRFHFLSFFFSPLATGSLQGFGRCGSEGGVGVREVYGRRKKAREAWFLRCKKREKTPALPPFSQK